MSEVVAERNWSARRMSWKSLWIPLDRGAVSTPAAVPAPVRVVELLVRPNILYYADFLTGPILCYLVD
jgi:hypothetical protein